jgi:hypothetical protein
MLHMHSVLKSSLLDCKFNLDWTGLDWTGLENRLDCSLSLGQSLTSPVYSLRVSEKNLDWFFKY